MVLRPSSAGDDDFGSRIRVARNLRRLTQTELATRAAMTPAFISQVEASQRKPNAEALASIAAAVSFPVEFFGHPLGPELRDEDCNFRRRKTTPQYLRAQILAFGTVFRRLVDYLEERLSLPAPGIPEQDGPRDPERAAEWARSLWQLGLDAPITSMMRVAEQRAGAVVARFSGAEDLSEKIDAFSRAGARDLIVLNPVRRTASRARFDLAHELGHLILHRHADPDDVDREPEADKFASAFLLPRAGFVPDWGPAGMRLSWPRVFALKRRWGASAAAIVRRAYDLSLIGPAEYRRAYKYMSAKRWLTEGEPDEPAFEQPETVVLAFAELKRLFQRTPHGVSMDLALPPEVLEQVVGGSVRVQPPPEPALRLVR